MIFIRAIRTKSWATSKNKKNHKKKNFTPKQTIIYMWVYLRSVFNTAIRQSTHVELLNNRYTELFRICSNYLYIENANTIACCVIQHSNVFPSHNLMQIRVCHSVLSFQFYHLDFNQICQFATMFMFLFYLSHVPFVVVTSETLWWILTDFKCLVQAWHFVIR